MNTIVAFSDSHNYPLPDRLVEVANESKFVFFLGDGISALGDLLCHKGFHGVKGNCDNFAFQDEEVIEIDKVKILITHGDKYHVKRGLLELYLRAQELGCSLVSTDIRTLRKSTNATELPSYVPERSALRHAARPHTPTQSYTTENLPSKS